VEITYGSVVQRITERLTLSTSDPQANNRLDSAVAKLFLPLNIHVNYIIYVKRRLPRMSVLAVSDHRPHTPLITYAQVEKPILNS